ncbi:hypothetical protein [Roseibium aggregatum]|uniref:hypothetical protein n=1 Tax=Roseibium aggregatum TaxID=187304 RepID=UPI003A983D97
MDGKLAKGLKNKALTGSLQGRSPKTQRYNANEKSGARYKQQQPRLAKAGAVVVCASRRRTHRQDLGQRAVKADPHHQVRRSEVFFGPISSWGMNPVTLSRIGHTMPSISTTLYSIWEPNPSFRHVTIFQVWPTKWAGQAAEF